MIYEEVYYIFKVLFEFFKLYKQKIWGYVWRWILNCWVELEKVKIFDMGILSRYFVFFFIQQRKLERVLIVFWVGWLKYELKDGKL